MLLLLRFPFIKSTSTVRQEKIISKKKKKKKEKEREKKKEREINKKSLGDIIVKTLEYSIFKKSVK